MKKIIFISVLLIFYSTRLPAQEIPLTTEQQLENQAMAEEMETEDDSYIQELEQYKKNPVNLNIAEESELKQLKLLTEIQIAALISYRHLFGIFISLYELQAVPYWDPAMIRKLLPYITIAVPVVLKETLLERFNRGEHQLVFRVSQVLEKSKGYDKSLTGNRYTGSPQRLFFRYRYNYKNLLQFGIVGDKDAGEQWFKGAQRTGFDFYSAHVFVRKIGIVQSLALGDFTVNMGQGLIQWQGLAFKKSAEVMSVKRQSDVLRPYSSAGEFYFHRGAGITIRKRKLESTLFVSFRKPGANINVDSLQDEGYVSSFLTSGYHRTAAEIEDRNAISQTTIGTTISYRDQQWKVGINGVYYAFSLPLKKRDEPYNYYSISGNRWYNAGIDYSYTYKNLHVFGEAAMDKRSYPAFINGLLLSVDPRVDISVVYRNIHAGYQSMQANAFTESTNPTNEKGFYAGVSIRPAAGLRIDMYGDLYTFPFLKYQADAPGYGKDFMLQLTYTPNRITELYTRFRQETKQANQPDNSSVTNFLVGVPKKSWRTQLGLSIHPAFTIRHRFELLWYDPKGNNAEKGFLSFLDILYKPMMKPFSGSVRLQYFETGGYNSRIYAYENDVLYSYSIPAFFDKGFQYYVNMKYDITRKVSIWWRWSRTAQPGKSTLGSGLDAIKGGRRSEAKVQIRWVL